MNTPFKSWQAIALIALSVTFSSCKKDEAEPDPAPTTNPATFTASFSAKVDGVEFNETILYGAESTASGTILVNASSNAGFPSLGFSVPNDITPGTYQMVGFASDYRGMYNVANSANGQYGTSSTPGGTIVITSHNTSTNEIVGTFNFVAKPNPGNTNTNSYNITNGSFSVHYN